MLPPSRGVLLKGRGGGGEVFFPPCAMKWRGSWGHYDVLKWNLNSAKKGTIGSPKPESAHRDSYHHSFPHSFIQQIFLLSIRHVLNSGNKEAIKANIALALLEFRTVGKANREIITHLIDSLQL